MTKDIIVSVGGGLASTHQLIKKLVNEYGPERIKPRMCVLPNEHPDTWRLCDAVEERYGVKFKYIAYASDRDYLKWRFIDKAQRTAQLAKTPIEIFFDVGLLGNSRLDPCSRILKRETMRHYLEDMWQWYKPYQLAIGIGAHELDRRLAIRQNYEARGIDVIFPLIDDEHLTREYTIEDCQREFGFVPELYTQGFSHNNCGGACIKAGLKEWARLLWYHSNVYRTWEEAERLFNEQKPREGGGNYTILRDRRNGEDRRITLAEFRAEVEAYQAAQPTLPGMEPDWMQRLPSTPACSWCAAA